MKRKASLSPEEAERVGGDPGGRRRAVEAGRSDGAVGVDSAAGAAAGSPLRGRRRGRVGVAAAGTSAREQDRGGAQGGDAGPAAGAVRGFSAAAGVGEVAGGGV